MKLIMVHGGVETPVAPCYMKILNQALSAGYASLPTGPLDAAEAAVKVLESHPLFNAGYGSVLNALGEAEMDAAMIDGATGRFGAVGAIKNIAHPVSVARKVLEDTSHVLLVGAGAERFAQEKGFPVADCVTEEMYANWEKAKAQIGGDQTGISLLTALPIVGLHAGDTVGCLVFNDGHLCAASSTGGSFMKLPGRVGDTPILGAGILATENGAVVCTGIGEAFIETMTANFINSLLEQGVSPQEAADRALIRLSSRKPLPGGIIVINNEGTFGASYNSYSFPVAVMVNGQLVAGFRPHQLPKFTELS